MKKALIVGHTGQDGTCLGRLLHDNAYEVIGISRSSVSKNNYGITHVNIDHVAEVEGLMQNFMPDEVYFLAAVHHSSSDIKMEDGELFQKSFDINVKALINFLESVRKFAPKTKLFYAASSHIFGDPLISPQNESTPFQPNCVYGITKTAGIRACHYYRYNHAIFTSVGIFYNHESPLRESKYVSKKIVQAAVAIKNNIKDELLLGSLDSQIDWGYAPDYMKAVYAMMKQKAPDDFVVSSGELHTINDFVVGVFDYLQLDPKKYVKVNPQLITKRQKQNLFGDSQKLRKTTGWSPDVDFKTLIKILVDVEMKRYASK